MIMINDNDVGVCDGEDNRDGDYGHDCVKRTNDDYNDQIKSMKHHLKEWKKYIQQRMYLYIYIMTS